MNWWDNHGTKALGSALAGIGAFQVGLPQLQEVMTKPHYVLLQLGTAMLVAVLGSLTIKRGFTNTANAPDAVGQQSGT